MRTYVVDIMDVAMVFRQMIVEKTKESKPFLFIGDPLFNSQKDVRLRRLKMLSDVR